MPELLKIKEIFLRMGETYFSTEPAKVITILGSCLSVTMFNRQHSIGAICHGLLPACSDYENCDKDKLECFSYVNCSVWYMLKRFHDLGIENLDIEIKMFGGANLLGFDQKVCVGQRNIEAAKKVILENALQIFSSDVGGYKSRKIVFFTHTGEVINIKY